VGDADLVAALALLHQSDHAVAHDEHVVAHLARLKQHRGIGHDLQGGGRSGECERDEKREDGVRE
jgi:hypothetical protein